MNSLITIPFNYQTKLRITTLYYLSLLKCVFDFSNLKELTNMTLFVCLVGDWVGKRKGRNEEGGIKPHAGFPKGMCVCVCV